MPFGNFCGMGGNMWKSMFFLHFLTEEDRLIHRFPFAVPGLAGHLKFHEFSTSSRERRVMP
jgi:hypothetical protein